MRNAWGHLKHIFMNLKKRGMHNSDFLNRFGKGGRRKMMMIRFKNLRNLEYGTNIFQNHDN